MIAAALLLATAVAPSADMEEPPIVVIARKLDTWRGTWRIDKGKLTCRTTRSSGDKAVDAIGCQSIDRCVSPHVSALRTLAESKLRKSEKRSQMKALVESSMPCMSTTRNAAIAELAAARVAR